MFRQLLEEAFEEFKQQVAPTRPEIDAPQRTPMEVFPPPGREGRPAPRAAMPEEGRRAPREAEIREGRSASHESDGAEARQAARAEIERRYGSILSPPRQTHQTHWLRAELSSPATIRNAFRIMEVLGPPVAFRDPLNRTQDR